MSHQTRLPTLGPRGEGWVLIQGFLLVAIAAAGSTGPAWSGDLHLATSGAGLLLILAGAILAVRGLADLRENLTPFPRPRDGARLVETGAYRLVRHPIYGGLIVGSAGWGLVTAAPLALVLAAVLFAFFDLKSRREEAWLAERFPGYRAYRARTKRFIPWTY
ncbi:MAG: methyltransferase family protein [Chloroflexota bacterium]